MKTAISIPDNIYKRVERTIKRMGISRSKLFTLAIEEYIDNHNPSQITEKLDSLYNVESSDLDPGIKQMQGRSIEKEEW
jgi:metal-responsive CopG/Arc/MetJ family transcriptional regulator